MHRTLVPLCFLVAAVFCLQGCNESPSPGTKDIASEIRPALQSFSADELLKNIRTLSSDDFEGRAPGTRGEELTIQYITEQFRRLGLKPGNPDGSYLQPVPLQGFKAEAEAYITSGRQKIGLNFPDNYVAVSGQFVPTIDVVNSDLVFVGYGIVAPEYGWDDFKGVDVKGKTLVMLINDPPVADPKDPAKLDEKMFNGKAMTYYGRWTYKYEIAAEKGAAAAIIVHETGPAGYPFEVVTGSWGMENFDINLPGISTERLSVESWVSLDKAREIFKAAGEDYDDLKKAAVAPGFRPVALRAQATFHIKNALREIRSNNVLARLDGIDPDLKNQYVVYTAHWDHLGKDDTLRGDQIYNGALDNASGVAGLLALAEAYTKLASLPRRSILFMALTAEEKGLLGAKYYANSPLYPLAKTAADINIDGLNPWGRTRDVVVIGLGTSTIDDVLLEAGRSQNKTVKPDPEPEKGFFFRSDHFEFAKKGVPALYTDSGTEFIGKASEYSRRKRDEYTAQDYHKVTDEIKPDWDLSGAVEELQLLFEAGYRIAQDDRMPEWKEGAAFKGKR